MANSCSKTPLGHDPFAMPTRTPGPLGHNDAASPDSPAWFLGDTQGPIGCNDNCDPNNRQQNLIRESSATMAKRLRVLVPGEGADVRLSDVDFEKAAKALGDGVSVAIIRAFAEVESGGKSGFNENRLPIIAYEGHIFRRITLKKYDSSHPLLSYKYVKKAGPEWRRNNCNQQAA